MSSSFECVLPQSMKTFLCVMEYERVKSLRNIYNQNIDYRREGEPDMVV
jgi:hypothetical protein